MEQLTLTDIIAACAQILNAGGYKSSERIFREWDTPTRRLYEDDYNVVAVCVFSTCAELVSSWAELQGALVELITEKIGSSEGKSWDGYLILIAMGDASDASELEGIRRNTQRLRKIVATGGELSASSDIERVLKPLLRLAPRTSLSSGESALDMLPELLSASGVNKQIAKRLVDAFIGQQSLLAAFLKEEKRQ